MSINQESQREYSTNCHLVLSDSVKGINGLGVPFNILIVIVLHNIVALTSILLCCYAEHHHPSEQDDHIDNVVDKTTAGKCI